MAVDDAPGCAVHILISTGRIPWGGMDRRGASRRTSPLAGRFHNLPGQGSAGAHPP